MRRTKTLILSLAVAIIGGLIFLARIGPGATQVPQQWKIHDRSRPMAPVITPGEPSTQDHAGKPPSDAVVLFNGKDLSNWESVKGGEAKWKVGDGYFEVAPGTGDIQTKQGYGDCQLHVEWAAPDPPHGKDQDRGNSGVFLHGLYEIQVLDSFESPTYADGQAAAVYGQFPPLVNACRPPGQWQTYDIVFHGARFDAAGVLLRRATVTVIQNGVLVQDHVKIMGSTAHMQRPPYAATPEKLPLRLQDHNHPVRYRNLWLREVPEEQP
jgi:3-keto-disaccharide hydrolase